MMQNRWFVLCGFILLCLAVGAIAGAFTASSVETWYPTLTKPSFNPPNWVFAPVWTTLYILMAVAAWRVWLKGAEIKGALGLFYFQLALNFLWSFLFFGAHALGLALLEIILLWLSIAITAFAFWNIDRPAGLLFVPYLAWVSFAMVLNFSLWWLNPLA
jgi:tryptophan-rich sensory protein